MKIRTVFAAVILILLAGCSVPRQDMKSPCAGSDGSPCGPHRPVNEWWIKYQGLS